MSLFTQIQDLLNAKFDVQHLEVLNESHTHNVPANSETHFKVTMVSDGFSGKSKVARHQAVYAALAAPFQEGLHALALHLYTLEEWQHLNEQSPASPNCMGGSKA